MMLSTLPTNLLLSNLLPPARTALLRLATEVELPIRTVLYEEMSVPRYAYFPLSGLASVVTPMPTGESAEVSFIGREGVTGSLHLLGQAFLPTRCIMQLPGNALRVPFRDIQKAFDDSLDVRSRILEFVQTQSAIVAQIAGCNRLHDVEQRLIRWLLMAQDQTGYDRLDFTQDYLSQVTSTQRSTVTVIAGNLQRRGLIQYSRGKIQILDRPRLEAATCACNATIKRLFSELYRRNTVLMSGKAMKIADPESRPSLATFAANFSE